MTTVLDGAMGTELARRGFELRPPLWGSAAIEAAPELVVEIHRDYARAGARVITTASFALGPQDASGAEASVELARRGAPRMRYAGSIGPPDPRTGDDAQRAHHRALGRALALGGATLLFIETQTCVDAARLAIDALRPLGLPLWVALACDANGRTLGGDALDVRLDADAVFVGCTELPGLAPALRALATHNAVLGVKPSLGLTTPEGFDPSGASAEAVRDAVVDCAARDDVAFVGGCCGTTPHFISSLARALRK